MINERGQLPTMRTIALGVLGVVVGLFGCDHLVGVDDQMVWSVAEFGDTWGVPYVDEEIVVSAVAYSTLVFAVERTTGSVLWHTNLDVPRDSFGHRHIPPTVRMFRVEDLLIVASRNVHALDRTNGRVVWTARADGDFIGRWAVRAGNRIIGTGAHIHGINPADGTVEWTVDVGDVPSAPIHREGVLYFGAQGYLREDGPPPYPLGAGHTMAFDLHQQEVLWKYAIDDHPTEAFLGGVSGEGVLTEDLFIVVSRNSRVYALDRITGEARWIHEGGSPYSGGNVALAGDVVVVGGANGRVEGLSLEDGELLWRAERRSSVSTITAWGQNAFVVQGRIRTFDASGQIVFGFGGAGWNEPIFQSAPAFWGDMMYVNPVSGGLISVRIP